MSHNVSKPMSTTCIYIRRKIKYSCYIVLNALIIKIVWSTRFNCVSIFIEDNNNTGEGGIFQLDFSSINKF